jgi:hypothetical protein
MEKKMIWFIILIVLIGAVFMGCAVTSDVEQAKYTVTEADSNNLVEIRNYAPHIIAQTEVSGDRKEAISKGFRGIADYIFGNNTTSKKVAMTAPVMQKTSEEIVMTAPVMQQSNGNLWKVEFVMPNNYTMDTLPKPNNDTVKLIEVPQKRFIVIRFSGFAGEETLQTQTNTLNAYMASHNLEALSVPVYAFYNPPWTLPFLRRNEIMIEIAQ